MRVRMPRHDWHKNHHTKSTTMTPFRWRLGECPRNGTTRDEISLPSTGDLSECDCCILSQTVPFYHRENTMCLACWFSIRTIVSWILSDLLLHKIILSYHNIESKRDLFTEVEYYCARWRNDGSFVVSFVVFRSRRARQMARRRQPLFWHQQNGTTRDEISLPSVGDLSECEMWISSRVVPLYDNENTMCLTRSFLIRTLLSWILCALLLLNIILSYWNIEYTHAINTETQQNDAGFEKDGLNARFLCHASQWARFNCPTASIHICVSMKWHCLGQNQSTISRRSIWVWMLHFVPDCTIL